MGNAGVWYKDPGEDPRQMKKKKDMTEIFL